MVIRCGHFEVFYNTFVIFPDFTCKTLKDLKSERSKVLIECFFDITADDKV